MKAATIIDGKIELRDQPDPEPGIGQLLIKVRAAGINSADLGQRAGFYPPPPGVPADIPGLELAGEVVATGPNAHRFTPGDRVMAVVGGAAQAELAVVHEREAMPVPASLTWEQAGAVPEVFMTAHDALFSQCHLGMGERVCVHGAAGGVGTAAVQLASATGATVVATVRNPDLREPVARLGATAIGSDEMAAHGPYDVILELVGAPNMADNLAAIATGGRIVVIGVGGGAQADLNLGTVMMKRILIRGSTLRARPLEEKAIAARAMERHVLPLFQSGRVQVPIAANYPLSRVGEAYERFAAGSKFGKIVVTVP